MAGDKAVKCFILPGCYQEILYEIYREGVAGWKNGIRIREIK